MRKLFILCIGFLIGTPVWSAGIAVVDVQKCLQSVQSAKKARSMLEKEFLKKKSEIAKDTQKLQRLQKAFEKKSLVLSEKKRKEKQMELQKRFMALQQKQMRFQRELRGKEKKLMAPILGKLRKVIHKIASKKGYDAVIVKNENLVFYYKKNQDITGAVIRKYNKTLVSSKKHHKKSKK